MYRILVFMWPFGPLLLDHCPGTRASEAHALLQRLTAGEDESGRDGCTILCYAIRNYTILYYTILYYTVLYYTVLHHKREIERERREKERAGERERDRQASCFLPMHCGKMNASEAQLEAGLDWRKHGLRQPRCY